MNRLDKIARRSKRVGGAIADLWGSHLVGTYYRVSTELIHNIEKLIYFKRILWILFFVFSNNLIEH